jgi:hypothetical protein
VAPTGMLVGMHPRTGTDAHFDVCFDVRPNPRDPAIPVSEVFRVSNSPYRELHATVLSELEPATFNALCECSKCRLDMSGRTFSGASISGPNDSRAPDITVHLCDEHLPMHSPKDRAMTGRRVDDILRAQGYHCPICGEPHDPATWHSVAELRALEARRRPSA